MLSSLSGPLSEDVLEVAARIGSGFGVGVVAGVGVGLALGEGDGKVCCFESCCANVFALKNKDILSKIVEKRN